MNKFYLTKTKFSPYWQVIYFVNGKRTSKSTNTNIKSEALFFLTQFKESINRRKVIPKTLIGFECEYISWISNTHSKSYIERAVKLSFKMLKDFIGKDILLTDITTNVVDNFFSSTFSRAEYSARLYLRTLKSAFNTAIRWGLIEINVFSKIKPPRAFKTLPSYINEVDLSKICDVTKEDYLKELFEFAFLSGARLGEILVLTWDNINLNEKIIHVSNSETFQTKNKQDRIIPINNRLAEILTNMVKKKINASDLLFYKVYNVKLNSNFVSKKFKKSVRIAGLSNSYHFHVLRHSFASIIHQKGASLTVVKELLGHQDLKTTLIYSHLSRENLVNAVELIGTNQKQKEIISLTAVGVPAQIGLN
jgi:integrase/recombinase XerD